MPLFLNPDCEWEAAWVFIFIPGLDQGLASTGFTSPQSALSQVPVLVEVDVWDVPALVVTPVDLTTKFPESEKCASPSPS